jgi:arabinofuranan 3-O-arabinosyltransferase
VAVTTWQADQRRVQIGAGPESWLIVQENANAGWQATLRGHRLTPAVVDGWKQAFIVPAGAGGSVALSFAPDHSYRVALLVGAILAALLVASSLLEVRRRRPPTTVLVGPPPSSAAGRDPMAPVTYRLFVAGTALLTLAAGGEYAAAALALGAVGVALLGRFRPHRLSGALVGGGAVGLAAAAAAAALHPAGAGSGAVGSLAQAGTSIALAAVTVAVWQRPAGVVTTDQLAGATE